MLLNPVTVHTPRSITEAASLFSTCQDARVIAGGTFLLNSLKLLKRKGAKTPQNIISLRKVDELKGVSADAQRMSIGAMTIINDLFASNLLTDNFKVFRTVCRNISTDPIRNMATFGGILT